MPASVTASSASSQHYGGIDTSFSTSLSDASFTAKLDDGVSDLVLSARGKNKTFRFYPDRDSTKCVMTQGYVTASVAYPVDGPMIATFAVSPSQKSVEYFID